MIFFFFFNDTATTEIYTLSLHDALPSPYRILVSVLTDGSTRISPSHTSSWSSDPSTDFGNRSRANRGGCLVGNLYPSFCPAFLPPRLGNLHSPRSLGSSSSSFFPSS